MLWASVCFAIAFEPFDEILDLAVGMMFGSPILTA